MNKVFKKISSILPEGLAGTSAPKNDTAHFDVLHENIAIGRLTLNEGTWYFAYSEEFKNQNYLKPLIDFPDVDKVYESDTLWPFFAIRIPSLKQPKIQKIIEKEHIDGNNQVELLRRFGKKSISNPYLLIGV